MSQVGECARSGVRVDQCVSAIGAVQVPVFWRNFSWHIESQNTSWMPPCNSRDAGWSVPSALCNNGKWVGRGGHLVSDTRWLLSRDWDKRTVRFVTLALKVFHLKSCGLCGITRGILSQHLHGWTMISNTKLTPMETTNGLQYPGRNLNPETLREPSTHLPVHYSPINLPYDVTYC